MYRAVALAFIRHGDKLTADTANRLLPSIRIHIDQADDGLRISLNDEDVTEAIRRPDVTSASSRVAALAPVREKLVEEQRRIADEYEREGGGVVLEGRDIGTVVLPNAGVKIFMTASEEVRAQRRYVELVEKEADVTLEDVLDEIRRRDERDASRALAPLRKAADAIEIDTSKLNVEEQINVVIQAVTERGKSSAV